MTLSRLVGGAFGVGPKDFEFRGMCLSERDLRLVVPEGLEVRDPADLDRGVPVSGLPPGAGPRVVGAGDPVVSP